MYKIQKTYTDYNGNERTEDFWFNLSKSELVEMAYSVEGGLEQVLEKIIKENDKNKIITFFKDLVLRAYGEKSADGRRFMKSDEISKAFSETPAYSDIFMDLATDANAASAFVNGIMPSNLAKELESKSEIGIVGNN